MSTLCQLAGLEPGIQLEPTVYQNNNSSFASSLSSILRFFWSMATKRILSKSPSVRRNSWRLPSYISVSSIWDLRNNLTDEQERGFKRLFNLTNRRSFKNTKDGSEPVWAPEFEAALLQGLHNYTVLYGEEERARGLSRGLYRNIFISNFILETTNKIRTPKQVSSRLQQLRGTTTDEDVLRLINRLPIKERTAYVFVPPDTHPQLMVDEGSSSLNSQIFIAVKSHSARYPSLAPEIFLQSPPQDIRLRTLAEWQPYTNMTHGMDRTLVLLSPVTLTLYSTFELFRDNMSFSISASTLVPDGICNGQFRYLTSFPDDLWQELSDHRSHDDQCTKWSILQLVFRAKGEMVRGIAWGNPLVEIRYNFEPPGLEVQRSSAKLQKDCFRNTTCPPPPPPPPSPAQSMSYREASLLKLEEEFYSNAGTFNKGSAVPVDFGAASEGPFSCTGMFYSSNSASAKHSAPEMEHPSNLYEESNQDFFCDASVRSSSEPPSFGEWNNLSSNPETIGYQGNSFFAIIHNGVVGTPTGPQAPVRHAAYSITGEFMGYYPIHDY
ncbi:hypothetical protein B0H13DRAFT_966333 [Mycena leptocephala]|nr:hypothetical protein B0H13DRAFT_966333 [Mycena leptocephala]